MPRPSRLTLTGAGLYGAALILVGLWPTHIDEDINVIGWAPVQWMIRHFDLTPAEAYNGVEFGANVVLFVPLGLLAMVWSPRSRWVHAVAGGLVLSSAIELVQAMARPDRTASWVDVLANTIGAGLGAAAVGVWRVRRGSVT